MKNTKVTVTAGSLALSLLGAVMIQNYEGLSTTPYKDAVGVSTVCWGSTENVVMGKVVSYEECVRRFVNDVAAAEQAVRDYVKVPVTQRQFDSLVSFTFNLGVGNFSRSTLLKLVNARECYGAAKEFLKWNKAGGRVLPGLTKRRIEESRTFLEDCDAWGNGKFA